MIIILPTKNEGIALSLVNASINSEYVKEVRKVKNTNAAPIIRKNRVMA